MLVHCWKAGSRVMVYCWKGSRMLVHCPKAGLHVILHCRQPPTIVQHFFCGFVSCPCLDHEAESVPVKAHFCWRYGTALG